MNNLFSVFSRWSKASKCKTVIKRLQCRLKLLKDKRDLIIRQSREDILRLLENGQNQRAFDRAEKLYEDQGTVDVYELLENFCEFIMINLPYIWKSRDFRNDINGAASSLIYASARCGGDLPELLKLRRLFGDRYGNKFELAAVELLPGNLVIPPLIKKLSAKSVSDDAKFRLMKEIFKENGYAFYYDD
ncbi:IST1 homolog [Papaver somniferum]|uniref:IST1 homolog n=1 Tax=Papaver somniferum TaxID=3469 RepID=UPI000E6FE220|nr:IST1 homolog [Papaver somniferum]